MQSLKPTSIKNSNRFRFFFIIVLLTVNSCGIHEDKEEFIFYNSLKEHDLIVRINADKTQIKKLEINKKLLSEDDDFLKYTYVSNEKMIINCTYLFDEKGCFEIGLEINYENENEVGVGVDDLTNQFKKYVEELNSFTDFKEDNSLLRWAKKDKSKTIEMDISNASSGKILITIFANE